nr:methyltransferase domain-containing protein [Riemerella anatipestifer]
MNQNYWNDRWKENKIGWDIGFASPPIVEYMKQYPNKDAKILIPGCGNAYEAEFLIENGFQNITLIDIAPKAVDNLKIKFHKNPHIKVICEDFFRHNGKYDLIIEQTFFCAINPNKRTDYIKKVLSLLKENGQVVGVLFNKIFEEKGPPFGGLSNEYINLFEPFFKVKTLEPCYNSISPRANSELFINLIKKV